MYKKRECLLQVSISKGESIGIVDGGKQLVFRRNNLPVHHFVVDDDRRVVALWRGGVVATTGIR